MNTAQRTKFVLNATKSYPVKGGNLRKFANELRRTASKLKAINRKINSGQKPDKRTQLDITREIRGHASNIGALIGASRDRSSGTSGMGHDFVFLKNLLKLAPRNTLEAYAGFNRNLRSGKSESFARREAQLLNSVAGEDLLAAAQTVDKIFGKRHF